MQLTTRNKNEVFYLVLSPRMSPSQFAEYMEKGDVSSSQVITINSKYDFPHKIDIGLTKKSFFFDALAILSPAILPYQTAKALPAFWHDYESAPETGTHLFIKYNYDEPSNLWHSVMYDGLANGERFDAVVNGNVEMRRVTLPQLINEIWEGRYRQ